MSTYFHHARIVRRSLATTLRSLAPPPEDVPVPLGENLVRWGREISFTDGTRASLRPASWLEAFEQALDTESSVSSQVLTCIERHGERYSPERFFPTAVERDQLFRVLTPRPGLYARLSEMHECGLLGRMFPEFQKIYCHVIRDFYHRYTVDEHTLLTIKTLESLCTPTTMSRKRFGDLLSEVDAPELLVLALLFHDVGKWTDKNHSEEGVRMALGALRRIQIPESDIATVEFLIRHHLRMSKVAFRRDSEDLEVVRQFARLVGTEDRLKLLCLLTLVDVAAVGPDVMSPWKEELLWQLYVDTYNRLTLDTVTTLSSQPPRDSPNCSAADPTISKQSNWRRFLTDCRDDICVSSTRTASTSTSGCRETSIRQTRTAHRATGFDLGADGRLDRSAQALREDLRRAVIFRMDILRGQAMSNRQGVALDIFQFTDTESFLRLNSTGQEQFQRQLTEVVARRQDIDELLRPKQRGVRKQRRHVRVIAHVDNQYSDRFSILEIVAPNAWGLLYRISRVISRHDCDIDLVLVSTEGRRAIDVFHLTKGDTKLTNEEASSLCTDLEAFSRMAMKLTKALVRLQQG